MKNEVTESMFGPGRRPAREQQWVIQRRGVEHPVECCKECGRPPAGAYAKVPAHPADPRPLLGGVYRQKNI